MFQANIVPGQGFLPFKVYRKGGGLSAGGRPMEGKYKLTDTFYGMIVNASQKEIDQWKQNGHPITHKVIQYGHGHDASHELKVKATDYISVDGLHDLYVQGVKPPAHLGVTNIYYVEERFDLKKELG